MSRIPRAPVQETFSADVLVDKLLKARVAPNEIINIVNTTMSSKRKLDVSYIDERLGKIAKYQQQLGKLLRLPKVEQRSQEWHDMRKGLVTASEFAQALGKAKFGTQKDFYKKKCGYDKIPFNPGEAPLKWGTMYEDVAAEIYKSRFGYELHDFGLLQHPKIKHFGASPDGINEFGVMVEIKCPYRRKITGEVPQQYYYQIQGQLSVCDLDECDYIECELEEYGDLETWAEVGNEEKGIVIERTTEDPLNPWAYEYSPIYYASPNNTSEQASTQSQAQQWLDAHIAEDEKEKVVLHFWITRVVNNVRVYRDIDFINERFMELQPIWDKIGMYRDNYEDYKTDMVPLRGRAAAAARERDAALTLTTLAHAPSAPPALNPMSSIAGYSFLDDE